MTGAAFITYGGDDAPAAATIAQALSRQGLAVSNEADDHAQAVMGARCLVALVPPPPGDGEQVRRDITAAISNARPIVPVLVRDAADADPAALRGALDLLSRIDARGGVDDTVLGALAETVRRMAGAGRVITMLNIKGGVGKTVLAANLFAAAHLEGGRSVAFIDLDPQHNLSQYFLPPDERNRVRADAMTVYSALIAKGPLAAPRENFARLPVQLNRSRGQGKTRFDLVVGDERLFEFTLDGRTDRERTDALSRFHDLVATLRTRYDLVVIDSNPCATFLTRCAVTAADHIVAPVRPERYSLTGLNMLEQVVRDMRGRPLRPSEFSVLLNGMGDRPRARDGAEVDSATREEIASAPFFGSALLSTPIPFSTRLRSTPVDQYVVNPINLTAMRLFAQRSLKESLAGAADEIVRRASVA